MAEVKGRMTRADERTSHQIRDNIRQTRAQMDRTVDAIEDRLSPGELMHEAWGLFRGGSGSSVNRVARIAKQHPMPAAIIGVGLAWMVYENTGRSNADARRPRVASRDEAWTSDREMPTALESARRRAAGAARGAGGVASDVADRASDMASDVAGSVRRAGEAASDTAGDVAQTASELAGQARDAASEFVGSVRRQASEAGRQASELGDQARQGMAQARTGFWDALEEQPLVVGAATLAAGLLVGLLLPSTPREDELMGSARDSLIDEVKGLGQEALEKSKHVAAAAAESLKQSAEAQGLGADSVVDKVRAVGRDVADTVKAEAEKYSPEPPRHRAA